MRGLSRKKKVLYANQVLSLQQRVAEGDHKSQLVREMGISREAPHQYLKRHG